MAKTSGGLTKWFSENWVDISAPKKGGGFKLKMQNENIQNAYPKQRLDQCLNLRYNLL